MQVSAEDIASSLRDLSDEALLQRYCSGTLGEVALPLARAELLRRGLPAASAQASDATEPSRLDGADGGRLIRLGGHLDYSDAQLLRSLLESEGIPAVLVDAHLATGNPLLSLLVGGVRLFVHEDNLHGAQVIVAAFKRGDYRIDDDFDVGPASDH